MKPMASSRDILLDCFDRVRSTAAAAVNGLTEDALADRIAPDTNTIAWLVWHLARVQDDHVAAAAGSSQVWLTGGWKDRFDLPVPADAIGYGFSSEQVGQITATAQLLTGYLDAVHSRTTEYVEGLDDAELDRVVDDSYD